MVFGLTAVLASAPAVVAALPAAGTGTDAATLLRRLQASDDVPWSGYGESRGDLVLPDAGQLGSLPELISGTTRMRAWWRGRQQYRVDTLSLVGETDTAVSDRATWTWDSTARRARLAVGEPSLRLPRAADLLAPPLGARLSRTASTKVERLPARRVAGLDAAGLRLRPAEPRTTTVDYVDVWVEPRTGLALRVELHARQQERPALTSLLLDADLSPPRADAVLFSPPADARVEHADAADLAATADREAPFALPATLAGLPRRQRVEPASQGVATYGDGFTALALVPLQRGQVHPLLQAFGRPGDPPDRARFSTVLLQGLVAHEPQRAYLLVGTVPPDLLDSALAQLRAAPPPLRETP